MIRWTPALARWMLWASMVALLAGVPPRAAAGAPVSGTVAAGCGPTQAAPSTGDAVLADGLWLGDVVATSQNAAPPAFAIQERLPHLCGSPAAAVAGFNQAIQTLIEPDVTDFQAAVAELGDPTRPTGPGSFLDVGYTVSVANDRVVSLFIDVDGYIEGAAHPYGYRRGFTYDLREARPLDLADLFLPDSDYLPRLAAYATAQLTPSLGDAFFAAGAAPTAENYATWNLQADALVIEFNEYQVAPYAAGPQTVAIPYAALADILQDDDRLGSVRGQ